MDPLYLLALTFVAAYLVGGLPFGYLVARARGVDIFKEGSGNIGATNVGRVLGRRFGVLVFLLDFAKGALPSHAALHLWRLAESPPSWLTPDALGVVAGLGAFLGHLFPVYLRFHGGKGVATGAGVVAVLVPGPALGGLVVWVAVVAATRYVSAASVAAAAALAALRLVVTDAPFAEENLVVTLFCLLTAGLVLLRHRSNLARLARGTENQLREGPTMQQLVRTAHVLALGVWLGSTVFFTFVVGPWLFRTFEAAGQMERRYAWFPRPGHFEKSDEVVNGPREQGTRAAGAAVGAMFPLYFLLQGACGLIAAGTALSMSRADPGGVHRLRATLLLVALVTVLVGWPLERRVHDLREPRYQTVDKYLSPPPGSTAADLDRFKEEALEARRTFGLWHTVSLLLNFGTIALVAVGMALAARLPAPQTGPPPQGKNGQAPQGEAQQPESAGERKGGV